MAVSTPEVTAFDLVRYVHACGGLSNVATLLAELGERLDPLRLGDAARAGVEIPVAQRLGHLLDRLVTPALTDPLHEWTLAQTPRLARLRADLEGTDGDRDGRWLIVVNEEIEADI